MMKNKFQNYIMLLTVLLLSDSTVLAATKAQNELMRFATKLAHIFGGVILSIIVIYVCLVLYKRFKNPYIQTFIQNDKQNTLLSSENLDDAIEHFIKDSE